MLFLLILTAAVAFLCTGVVVRYRDRLVPHPEPQRPQRFHAGPVPRVGGLAMMAGCLVGWGWMVLSGWLELPNQIRFAPRDALALAAVAAVAVGAGVFEDLTHRVSVRWRLLLTGGAAALAAWWLGLQVPRLGVDWLDLPWQALAPGAGIALAVLAVTGLPHAFNLIDGYNGLAGIVALIVALALGYVALQVGDRQLAALMVVLAGSTAGFLVWNYPRGLVFAGDGGAYLWGLVIAVASLLLVLRHPQVSPWFPVLLLIYPVWETLFSIFRKVARGQSPGVADALHFHQLIFRRIVRGVFHDDAARRMLIRNNRTSPYLWGFTVLTVIPAVLFWHRTGVLMVFSLLFVVAYIWAYNAIVRFRVPRWLRH